MSGAILALRTAVSERLRLDPGLGEAIGPDRIYERPPRGACGPYLVLGDAEARDRSSGDGAGCEIDLSLALWGADAGSARAVLEAAGLVVRALDGAELPLVGHRLVLLRWVSTRLARDRASDLPVVTVRLRALTEPL